MTTSLYGRFINYAPADLDEGDAMDVQTARTVVNNANNLADGAGQVRVASACFTPTLDAKAASGEQFLASFGPFPVTLGLDGKPYKLRVRASAQHSGHAGGAATFSFVFSTFEARDEARTTADASVIVADSLSANLDWIVSSAGVLLPDSRVAEMTKTVSTVDTAGNAVSVDWVWCMLNVTVDSLANGSARLGPLYVAEFIG